MDKLMQIVEEEVELAKKRISTRIKRIFKDGNQTSAGANLKLKFRNKISQTILTGQEIKGEGNTSIEVALVHDPTGNVVDDGPEASATVEIVLLKGEADASEGEDWTVEEFKDNIVPEVEGKQPLLAGNVHIKLQRGIGVVENVRFRHHASKIRPSVFKLGAIVIRAPDGDRIKEAKTESFTVKDFRDKYYQKRENPSLVDEVSRLVNIRRGGKIDKRLQANEINTVEDFLIRHLIDPEGLKSIVKLPGEKWKATIKNAQACLSDKRMYSYINLEQKAGVVFNVLGQVLGLYFESDYHPASMLSENHKADAQELLASACEHWGNVEPFDKMDSLLQYFTDLVTPVDPLDSVKLDHPAGGHETGTSEMVGESSSRRSNISFHSASSTMNLTGEIVGEDFASFSIDDVEIIMHDTSMQLSPGSPFNPNTMFQDFDEFYQQNDSCKGQLNGLVNERNADEQSAATAATSLEPEVVQTSNPPKRWKKLLCISRWFSIRKRVSEDDTCHRKKQKVDKQ